jgi:hypothetical protein
MKVQRLIADITPELKQAVISIAEQNGEKIADLVERLLRAAPEVDQFRKENAIEWRGRPVMGRPKKPVPAE